MTDYNEGYIDGLEAALVLAKLADINSDTTVAIEGIENLIKTIKKENK